MLSRAVTALSLVLLLVLGSSTATMLGGFSSISNPANDAQVEAAKEVAAQGLSTKGLAGPLKVEVVGAERQVVAGTNYRLKLRVQDVHLEHKYFEAVVWERLPCDGGVMELSRLQEISPEAAGFSPRAEQQVLGTNPEVEDAAAFAVEQLSQQSNSLYPFTLRKIVSATTRAGEKNDEVMYHLKLNVQQGTMPEITFEVEVAHSPRAYYLRKSQQQHAAT